MIKNGGCLHSASGAASLLPLPLHFLSIFPIPLNEITGSPGLLSSSLSCHRPLVDGAAAPVPLLPCLIFGIALLLKYVQVPVCLFFIFVIFFIFEFSYWSS